MLNMEYFVQFWCTNVSDSVHPSRTSFSNYLEQCICSLHRKEQSIVVRQSLWKFSSKVQHQFAVQRLAFRVPTQLWSLRSVCYLLSTITSRRMHSRNIPCVYTFHNTTLRQNRVNKITNNSVFTLSLPLDAFRVAYSSWEKSSFTGQT